MLGVSTSGYYARLKRGRPAREKSDSVLAEPVRAIHDRSRGTYGAPRTQAELADEGFPVSRKRAARLTRESALAGVSRRKRPKTTRRAPSARPEPDLVERRFPAEGPDRLWLADIERLCRSLKHAAVYLRQLASGLRARGIIGGWTAFFNEGRPHTALGSRTPAEAHGSLIDIPKNREFATAPETEATA